jgi:hypothetical protein
MMVARRSSVVALEVGSIHAGSRQRERARPGDRHSNCSSSSESRIGSSQVGHVTATPSRLAKLQQPSQRCSLVEEPLAAAGAFVEDIDVVRAARRRRDHRLLATSAAGALPTGGACQRTTEPPVGRTADLPARGHWKWLCPPTGSLTCPSSLMWLVDSSPSILPCASQRGCVGCGRHSGRDRLQSG